MNTSSTLARQGQRLLQIGIVFILYSSFEGVVIPRLGSPRVGLSAHALGALQAVLLLVLGLLWPKLRLGITASRVAFWCLVYSAIAILGAYSIAALWGVGITTIALAGELPHGLSHGTAFQEMLIEVAAYSSGAAGLISLFLVLWGLRDSGVGQDVT
jgi:(hydroxyamino)benzene mutase